MDVFGVQYTSRLYLCERFETAIAHLPASLEAIFDEGQTETADPLEQLLLQMIRQEPGDQPYCSGIMAKPIVR